MLKSKKISVLLMPFVALLFFFFAPAFQTQASTDTTPPTITNSFTGVPQTTSVIPLTASDNGGSGLFNEASSNKDYYEVYKNGTLVKTDSTPWAGLGGGNGLKQYQNFSSIDTYGLFDADQTIRNAEKKKFSYEYVEEWQDYDGDNILAYIYSNTPLNLTLSGGRYFQDSNGQSFDYLDVFGLQQGVKSGDTYGTWLGAFTPIQVGTPDPTENINRTISIPLSSYVNGDQIQIKAYAFDAVGNKGIYTSPTYTIGVGNPATVNSSASNPKDTNNPSSPVHLRNGVNWERTTGTTGSYQIHNITLMGSDSTYSLSPPVEFRLVATGVDARATHNFTQWVDNSYWDDWSGDYITELDATNANYFQQDPTIPYMSASTSFNTNPPNYNSVSTTFGFSSTCMLCSYDVYGLWKDSQGNTSPTTSLYKIGLDGTGPSITFPSGDGSGGGNTTPPTINLQVTDQGSGLADYAYGGATVSFKVLQGATVIKTGSIPVTSSDGKNTYTGSFSLGPNILSSGSYQVQFTAQDWVGNTGSVTTGTYTVTQAISPLTGTITPNTTAWTNQPVVLTANGREMSNPVVSSSNTASYDVSPFLRSAKWSQYNHEYWVDVYNSYNGKYYREYVYSNNPVNFAYSNTDYDYDIHDANGKASDSFAWYDSSDGFYSDFYNPPFEGGGTLYLGSYDDQSFDATGETSLTNHVTSVTAPNNSTTAGTSGTYSASDNGTYTFTFKDDTGATVQNSYTVTNIDKTPPTITLSQPSSSNWTNNNQLTIGATDSQSGANTIRYQINGGTWSSYLYYNPTITLPDGQDTVTVEATDNVGNIASASYQYNIDTIAPSTSGSLVSSTAGSIYNYQWVKAGNSTAEYTIGISGNEGSATSVSGLASEDLHLIGTGSNQGKDIRARQNFNNDYWFYDDWGYTIYENDSIDYYQQDPLINFTKAYTSWEVGSIKYSKVGGAPLTKQTKYTFTTPTPCTVCTFDVYSIWTDKAGNTSPNVKVGTFGIDGVAPSITFPSGDKSSPNTMANFPASIPVQVTEQGSGLNSTTATYTLLKDGATFKTGSITLTNNSGTYNGTLALQSYVTQSGTYQLQISVQDNVGNTGNVTTGSYKVDKSPPSITDNLGGAQFVKQGGIVTYQIHDDSAMSTSTNVGYYINGSYDWYTGDIYFIPYGTFYDYSYSADTSGNGKYDLHFYLVDKLGNSGTFTKSYTVDATPPTASFSPNGTGGLWTNQAQTVTVTVNDPKDVFSNNGSGLATWQYRTSSDDGATYGSWTTGTGTSATVSIPNVTGKYRIQVQATDNVGNVGTITSQSYQIDTNVPTVTVSKTPNISVNYYNNNQLTIGATDSESGVKQIRWQSCNELDSNCGAWSSYFTGNQTITLSNGVQHIFIEATDNAGNVVTRSYAYYIDTNAPTSGGYEGDANATVSGISWVKGGSQQHTIIINGSEPYAFVRGYYSGLDTSKETLRLIGMGKDIRVKQDPNQTITSYDDWDNEFYTNNSMNYYQQDPLINFLSASSTWSDNNGNAVISKSTSYNFTTTCTLCTFDVYSDWADYAGNTTPNTKAFTLGIDGIAPSITFPSGDGSSVNWVTTFPTSIPVQVTDQGSGINSSTATYTITKNGTTFKTGTLSLTTSDGGTTYNGTLALQSDITQSGYYTVTVNVQDMVGNTGSLLSSTYKIDADKPSGTFSPDGSGGVWKNTSQNVTLTPSDMGGSGYSFKYRISTNDGSTYGSWITGIGTSTTTAVGNNGNGKYRIQMLVTDGAGNTNTLTSQSYLIDKTVPSISILGISDGTTYNTWLTGNPSSTITTSDADSGIDNASFSATLSRTYGGNTTSSAYTSGTAIIQSGDYTLTVTVKDLAGNQSTYSIHFTVNVDTTAPTINVSRPSSTTWSNNNQLTIGATDSESGVKQIRYQVNGGTWSSYFTVDTAITMPDGQNTITVEATDKAGNVGSQNYTYYIDTVAPPYTSGGVNNGALIANRQWVKGDGSQQSIHLSGDDSVYSSHIVSGFDLPNEDLRLVGMGKDIRVRQDTTKTSSGVWDDWYEAWYYTNGSVSYYQQDPLINFTKSDSSWYDDYRPYHPFTYDKDTTYYFNSTCSVCTFDIYYDITDLAGNVKNGLVGYLGIDGAVPVITFPSGDYSNSNWLKTFPASIPVRVTEQGSGLNTSTASYTFTKDGATVKTGTIALTTSDGGATYNGTLGLQSAVTQSGTYQITINVQDNVGNTGTITTGTYKIDVDNPSGTFSPDGTGSAWKGNQNVTVTPSDTGGSGIASWQYRVSSDDGATYASWITGTGGSATITLNTGKNRIQMQVTDGAGNTITVTSQSYWIDTTPPTINITGVVDGGSYTGATPKFPLSATIDNNAIYDTGGSGLDNASLSATLDRTYNSTTTTSSFTSGTAITTAGHYTLTVTIKDLAGNQSTKSVSFDVVPPPILTVSPVDNIDTSFSGTFVTPLQPTLSVTATATDPIPTAVLTLYYDIKETTPNGVVDLGAKAVSSVAPVNGTWDTSVWNTIDLGSNLVKSLPDGTNTIELWIQDDQGASSAHVPLNLIVDSASPSNLKLYDLPTDTSSVSIGNTIKFRVSAEDPTPNDGSYQSEASVNIGFDIRKNGVQITPTPITQVKLNGQPSDPIEMVLSVDNGYHTGDVITITPILDDGRGNILTNAPTYTVNIAY